MKILLIGEYSGAYKGLVEVLKKHNHQVLWIHDGDSYKKIQGADYYIEYKYIDVSNSILKFILKIYYNLLDFFGIKGLKQILSYNSIISELKDFDIVQLVNTKPLSGFGSLANLFLVRHLVKNNENIFLSALGDDYNWVVSCIRKQPPYSMFDRMNIKNFLKFKYSLLYVYGVGSRKLNNFVINNVKGIIPGLYDYLHAYKSQEIPCENLVPLIVKPNKLYTGLSFDSGPIKIFHGWQKGKDLRKGNDIFHKAIERLRMNYPDLIEYEIVSELPFDEYVKKYENSHIFIDQCFSLDQGMNGLLGMAAGKVVFSGFDEDFIEYLGVDKNKKYLINALPDEDMIYKDLEYLILNRDEMKKISKNALQYIEEFHNEDRAYIGYMNIWLAKI